MLDFLQPIFPFAFAILWFGGTVTLIIRMQRKQGAYLRQFPPDTFDGTLPKYSSLTGYSLGYSRRIGEAERTTRPDPTRERLRREVLRGFLHLVLWIFGFPLVTFSIIALFTASGLVHPH